MATATPRCVSRAPRRRHGGAKAAVLAGLSALLVQSVFSQQAPAALPEGVKTTGGSNATQALPPAASATGPADAATPHDLPADGACKKEIADLCKDMPAGTTHVTCLGKAMRARQTRELLSSQCMAEFAKVYRTMAQSTRFNSGPDSLMKLCEDDRQKFCKPGNTFMVTKQCLVDNIANLSIRCRNRVKLSRHQRAANANFDIRLEQACRGPDLKDCPPTTPKGGEKIACLRGKRANLTEKCRAQVFRRDKEDSEDIRNNLDVFNSCQAELKSRCADVESGETRKLRCLWQKSRIRSAVANADFSPQCRQKVDALTHRSMQDYRLDFRVSRNCQSTIDTHCSTERASVDSLTVIQLFGGTTAEGMKIDKQSGQVLACLRKLLASSATGIAPLCKSAVRHMVKVEAATFGTDPTVLLACSADKDSFCNGEAVENTHQCLRKNIKDLSKNCADQVVTQGQLESSDVNLKPKIARLCQAAIKNSCPDVTSGKGKLLRCLQDKRDTEGFPVTCRQAVEADLEASNHDWRLKYGISTECQEDVSDHCQEYAMNARGADTTVAGSVLTCLAKQMAKSTLRNGCNTEMKRYVTNAAVNIKLAPHNFQVCRGDINRLCETVEPGDGKVHDCLLEHRQDLNQECAEAEFLNEQLQSMDIALAKRVHSLCRSAEEKLCKGVASGEGKMWNCLEDNLGKADMDGSCSGAVKAKMAVKHSNFLLNPKLAKYCKVDAHTLCSDYIGQVADEEYWLRSINTEGEVITCLIENRAKIKDESCNQSLWRKEKQRASDMMLDKAAQDLCGEDAARVCPRRSGPGAVRMCLQRHLPKLQPACQEQVRKYMKLAATDIRFNQRLHAACKVALHTFCPNVRTGKNVWCLLRHMHNTGMDPACRDELAEEQSWRSTSLEYNPALKAACHTDLADLLGVGKCGDNDRSVRLGPDAGTQNGWKIRCLNGHFEELKDVGCLQLMRQLKLRMSGDFRASATAAAACPADFQRLCKQFKPGDGRGQKCLMEHIDEIQNEACKSAIRGINVTSSRHASMNHGIDRDCATERDAFCKKIQHGDGRLLACLGMHMTEQMFGAPCKKALAHTDMFKAIKEHPATAAMSALDRYGGVLIAGIVGFVVAIGMFVSHYVVTRKFLGGHYSVAPPPQTVGYKGDD